MPASTGPGRTYSEVCYVVRDLEAIGRNAFFDAVDSLGFVIELLEIPPETAHMMDDMHAARLAWDGRDPIRSLL